MFIYVYVYKGVYIYAYTHIDKHMPFFSTNSFCHFSKVLWSNDRDYLNM